MKKYYGLLSKNGAHPPLATQKDAELALILVENLADKIITFYEGQKPFYKAFGPQF
jgi:hypothetical protein